MSGENTVFHSLPEEKISSKTVPLAAWFPNEFAGLCSSVACNGTRGITFSLGWFFAGFHLKNSHISNMKNDLLKKEEEKKEIRPYSCRPQLVTCPFPI